MQEFNIQLARDSIASTVPLIPIRNSSANIGATTDDVLVLAGLADPCGNIGTECRYDLLPIPFGEAELRKSVIQAIKADKWELFIQEISPQPYPFGVRCWVCRAPESRPLQNLMTKDWSETQEKNAARLIDGLAWNTPGFEFIWPNDDAFNEEAFVALRQALSQFTKWRLSQAVTFLSI